MTDAVHQPRNFTFPKHSFGSKGEMRSFKPGWFDKWPWMDYYETSDRVVCFYCSRASNRDLLPSGYINASTL